MVQDKLHLSSGEGAKAIDATFGCQTRETGLFHSQAVRVHPNPNPNPNSNLNQDEAEALRGEVATPPRVRVKVEYRVCHP